MTTNAMIDSLLLGTSLPMQRLRERIARIAQSTIPVLVHGPTGAGKELVARAIHAASHRSGAFVPFNVSAIQDTLFANALFGHVRGAFTGAITSTRGYLQEAHHGTVFMDEIGKLAMANQVTLLRALETRTYRPIGATDDQHSDFRVISAANESLTNCVQRKEFREDLFFRLRGVTVEVPPLHERLEDIPLLVRHFTMVTIGPSGPLVFTPAALRELQTYAWPGNIRELRYLVEAIGYLVDTTVIDAPTVATVLHEHVSHGQHDGAIQVTSTKRADFLAVMQQYGHDVSAVATHYRRTKATIYRWLQVYRIPTPVRRSRRRQEDDHPSHAPHALLERQEPRAHIGGEDGTSVIHVPRRDRRI